MRVLVGVKGISFEAMHATSGFLEKDLVPHGHTYVFSVEVEGDLGPGGFVVDFRALERAAREAASYFERAVLVPPGFENLDGLRRIFPKVVLLERGNPTLENMALELAERIYRRLGIQGLRIVITLEEGTSYYCRASFP